MPAPDLLTRAARFFLLAEQASHLGWRSRQVFWETFASSAGETGAHLPAMTAAVRKERDSGCLMGPAQHPLPVKLSPETLPWCDVLISAWESHRASSDEKQQNVARRALVRLDGCGMPDGMERPSRLPEWLAEARQIVGARVGAGSEPARTEPARTEPARTGESRMEGLKTLAALAAWRPARGVITPAEALREWVAFWQEIRRSKDPLLKGIATRALLNLPEADLRAASLNPVPPEQLLRDLTVAIPVAAERTAQTWDYNYLSLLDWHPENPTALPAAEVSEVAQAWLDVALDGNWGGRMMAWRQLIRWDRAGSLAPCGMDLLPFLVRAAQNEKERVVLWAMARWKPAAEAFTGTEKPDALAFLRELEAHWQHHRESQFWLGRASAWLAGIRLHQAGLASEPPAMFREAYLSAVVQEHEGDVLFVLAQWSPGAEATVALHRQWWQGWQSRLGEENEEIRQVVAFVLLHHALKNETGNELRRWVLEGWRTGTKEATEMYHRLSPLVFRFHEVRANLAAGKVPDFEAGPTPPAQRQYPRLALPPGYIAGREWKMENGELKMENDRPGVQPGTSPAPDGPSR